jgi:hypothetical protein
MDQRDKKAIEQARYILEQSRKSTPREQIRGLIEKGIIDERGQLLDGNGQPSKGEDGAERSRRTK